MRLLKDEVYQGPFPHCTLTEGQAMRLLVTGFSLRPGLYISNHTIKQVIAFVYSEESIEAKSGAAET